MKKIVLGAVALIAMATSASAADMAARPYTKAPPIAVAMYDWSGFYIGINGGGGSARKCWDVTSVVLGVTFPAVAEGCHNATGGTIGGQIGYRWQAASWVFGVEAQGNWANFRGSNVSTFPLFLGLVNNQTRVDAFGLFTGQVGYAWNNALLYVKGGAAVTADRYDGFVLGVNVDRATETRWGGVVGVGFEYGFTPNWSFALEYDHLFMGTRDRTFTSVLVPGAFSRVDRIREDVDMVTLRLNYRFGGGAVVAKY